MKNFITKHPVISGIVIYSVLKSLLEETAKNLTRNVYVVVLEDEEKPSTDESEKDPKNKETE